MSVLVREKLFRSYLTFLLESGILHGTTISELKQGESDILSIAMASDAVGAMKFCRLKCNIFCLPNLEKLPN